MVAVFAVAVARVVVITVFLLVVLVEVAFVVIVVGEVVGDGGNDHCYNQALHFFFLIKGPLVLSIWPKIHLRATVKRARRCCR